MLLQHALLKRIVLKEGKIMINSIKLRRWLPKVAEHFSMVIGSWMFIVVQTLLIVTWIMSNTYYVLGADPYPFILLNLFLSCQAAYTGPILLIAATKRGQRDRKIINDMAILQRSDHQTLVEIKRNLQVIREHQRIDIDLRKSERE